MVDEHREKRTPSAPAGPLDAHRHELLLKMYDQMFSDINRHIMTVWQSVATLAGAAAALALVEKQVISLDVAVAFVVLVCGWLLANCYDSSYWYNRNLVIIANIERQFLRPTDLEEIHYYFGKHRAKTSMLTHLRIQHVLGTLVLALTIAFHFVVRVVPGFRSSWVDLDLIRALPYAVGLAVGVLLIQLRNDRRTAYANFIRESPGITVDTTGVQYGAGHPTDDPPPPRRTRH